MNKRGDFPITLAVVILLSPAGFSATGTDKALYEDSIQATKQSIAQQTLDIFYHDALDYYRDGRYDDALQLLDKIYSINPSYEDVASLRETIHRKQKNAELESTMGTVKDWMKKGDRALSAGQRILAISDWKQALTLNPDYAQAKKKIQETNEALAKKEFEEGYIHYHHAELEDALDSWSNAVALDPTYKQKGLLLLMSKIELQVEKGQTSRLASQGFDQYQQGQLADALQSYEELLTLEPRDEEARRMTAKIKIQLGEAASKAAQAALNRHAYSDAIQQADLAISYGYQVSHARAIKTEAEHALQAAHRPPAKPTVASRPAVQPSSAPAPAPASTPQPPAQPVNPEEAQEHYRKGLAAMRTKDYHNALQELDIAAQLDPTDEHIYMARQRAQQESSAGATGDSQ